MKLEDLENFNELIVDRKYIDNLIDEAKKSNYDEYYSYLFLDYIFFDGNLKFKKLNENYINKAKKYLNFWVNSYVLTLKEKELVCGYILSFIAEKTNININKELKRKVNKYENKKR